MKLRNGFSLLELMLVMVVVASILLFAIITLRSRSDDKLVARTALEIQTLLQAAANYYTDQQSDILNGWAKVQFYGKGSSPSGSNFWPANLNTMVGDYIQTEQLCSVWPSLGDKNCRGHASYTGAPGAPSSASTNQTYYSVSIILPTKALALKLAARVPMSSISDTTLTAYIPSPGIQYYPPEYKNRGWITSAGALTGSSNMSPWINNNSKYYTIFMPNCPTGYEGHYIVSYLKQRTGHCYENKGPLNLAQIFHFDVELDYKGNPKGSGTQFQQEVSMSNHQDRTITPGGSLSSTLPIGTIPIPDVFSSCTVAGGISSILALREAGYKILYYMTFCVPNGQWKVKTSYCQDDKFFNDKAAQCSKDWKSYNKGTTCQEASTSVQYP